MLFSYLHALYSITHDSRQTVLSLYVWSVVDVMWRASRAVWATVWTRRHVGANLTQLGSDQLKHNTWCYWQCSTQHSVLLSVLYDTRCYWQRSTQHPALLAVFYTTPSVIGSVLHNTQRYWQCSTQHLVLLAVFHTTPSVNLIPNTAYRGYVYDSSDISTKGYAKRQRFRDDARAGRYLCNIEIHRRRYRCRAA